MRPKADIRKELAAQRDGLASTLVEEWSHVICERVLSAPGIAGAGVVLGYASKGNEVLTLRLLDTLIVRGTTVLLPSIVGDAECRAMEWRSIRNTEDLLGGAYGILEPPASLDAPPPTPPDAPVLIPGLAFAPGGERLGRGGGFYDGFLSGHPGPRIALAYEMQLVPALPQEAHDIRMDVIVTERRWLRSAERA
jgi:5-formyltetrahydrofolate cyclo-ligase